MRRAATRAVSAPVARAAPGAPGAKKRRGRRPRLALGGDAVHASKLARLLRDLHEQAADLAAPPPPRALDEATFAGGWPGADASTEDVAAALAAEAAVRDAAAAALSAASADVAANDASEPLEARLGALLLPGHAGGLLPSTIVEALATRLATAGGLDSP